VGLTTDDLLAVFVIVGIVSAVIAFDMWWRKRNG